MYNGRVTRCVAEALVMMQEKGIEAMILPYVTKF